MTYSGSRTFAASTGSVTFDVVKATPTMTVDVQPSVIHRRTTSPRLDVALAAPGQVVSGTIVVRQGGSILAVEQLDGGRTTLVLAPYKHEGEQRSPSSTSAASWPRRSPSRSTFTVQK